MKAPRPKEGEIQLSICQYLQARGHFFWRQNSYGIYRTSLQRHITSPYSMPGLPDIVVLRPGGLFVGLEVKRPGERQNENQELFEMRCKNIGAAYHVVYSIDDVIALGM